MKVIAVFLLLIGLAEAKDGLVDHPIVGDSLQYLDTASGGSDWYAEAVVLRAPAAGATCTWTENTDYNHGSLGYLGHFDKVGSKEDCPSAMILRTHFLLWRVLCWDPGSLI